MRTDTARRVDLSMAMAANVPRWRKDVSWAIPEFIRVHPWISVFIRVPGVLVHA
ncbi:MAG: hypothetical protein IPP91_13395 [Betaproteobacteria bacterium]|nr:hypothetical protein [Betaproteobacteria bacterium]